VRQAKPPALCTANWHLWVLPDNVHRNPARVAEAESVHDACVTGMIVEGILTSLDEQGVLNVAPMGPIVEGDFQCLLLRPFQPSRSYLNLAATRRGVFHIVDEVDLIARIVTGELHSLPETEPATQIEGRILKNCCRWFELEIESIDSSSARSEMTARVVHRGERRPFLGFNRARHAVIEAAILATRLHLIPHLQIASALEFMEPAVEKTGDVAERNAFDLVKSFITERISAAASHEGAVR
jgi:hypothetical protein